MVKGMFGFTSIQTYIDMHTLLFLGSLCRLQPEDTSLSKGFITDIVFILHKYRRYLEEFTTSTFPCKPVWKYVCKDSVLNYEQYMWSQRINASSECFSLP